MNKKIEHTLKYHEKTKHSQINVMNSGHYLDWNNRPIPFKIYSDLTSRPLAANFPIPSMNAIKAIRGVINNKEKPVVTESNDVEIASNHNPKSISLTDISSLLFFSCGITRHMKYGSTSYYMRAASATGALYPIEVYLVCDSLTDKSLDAGVYHFNPGEFSLVPLRSGDYRNVLSSFAGNNVSISNSAISLVFTSDAWRNAWKYQSRSYRHWFWDAGVIIANLLAVGHSMDLNVRLTLDFIDDKVNNLLGLETHKEASIVIASLDHTLTSSNKKNGNRIQETTLSQDQTIVKPISHNIYPLSSREIFYPEIWKAYDSSKLLDNKEVASWSKIHHIDWMGKNQQLKENKQSNDFTRYYLAQDLIDYNSVTSIGKVILKRGSTRNFLNDSIPSKVLSSILLNSSQSCGNIPVDYKADNSGLIDYYILINSVEGLESGGYYLDKYSKCLEFLRKRPTKDFSGHLCLDQSLFADASAVIFLMADLGNVLGTLGNRGYRAAQLESGIIAGKIYLLSYACGIGASGSTFYDDEVTDFFCPNNKQMATMMAIGLGVPSYKSRSGTILPLRLTKNQMIGENSTVF